MLKLFLFSIICAYYVQNVKRPRNFTGILVYIVVN